MKLFIKSHKTPLYFAIEKMKINIVGLLLKNNNIDINCLNVLN